MCVVEDVVKKIFVVVNGNRSGNVWEKDVILVLLVYEV